LSIEKLRQEIGHDVININTYNIITGIYYNNKLKCVNDNEPIEEWGLSFDRTVWPYKQKSKTVHCIGNLGTLMRPCMKSVMIIH